jgi:hypothetical protein
MPRDEWEKIKHARQREVICRLMIDLMRNVHGAYAPKSEPFGTRIEAFFIALCVAIGDVDGKPFSVSKIAGYMRGSARYGHAHTGTATGVGLGATPWPLLFPAAKDTQFPHRPPELPKDQM